MAFLVVIFHLLASLQLHALESACHFLSQSDVTRRVISSDLLCSWWRFCACPSSRPFSPYLVPDGIQLTFWSECTPVSTVVMEGFAPLMISRWYARGVGGGVSRSEPMNRWGIASSGKNCRMQYRVYVHLLAGFNLVFVGDISLSCVPICALFVACDFLFTASIYFALRCRTQLACPSALTCQQFVIIVTARCAHERRWPYRPESWHSRSTKLTTRLRLGISEVGTFGERPFAISG